MASATGLTGAAGEYYVAAELSRRDWLATVTIKNSPRADVLAQRPDGSRIVAIQTKTSSGNSFRLADKDERPESRDHEWYVLVALRGPLDRPSFYIVPRHVIAALAYLEHREWLANTGRLHNFARGVRNENPGRTIRALWVNGYLERWDLLDGSAYTAPYLGEAVFLELADEIGLPDAYRRLRRTREVEKRLS
jgi:hypothetical protein